MSAEELIEEGIVIESKDGFIDIAIISSENCEECSAKIICKPGNNTDTKIIHIKDDNHLQPGDEVKISLEGGKLFTASFLLYGIPLILFVGGIAAGLSLFESSALTELYSFLIGLMLTAGYFGILFRFNLKKKDNQFMPRVISVKRRSEVKV